MIRVKTQRQHINHKGFINKVKVIKPEINMSQVNPKKVVDHIIKGDFKKFDYKRLQYYTKLTRHQLRHRGISNKLLRGARMANLYISNEKLSLIWKEPVRFFELVRKYEPAHIPSYNTDMKLMIENELRFAQKTHKVKHTTEELEKIYTV